MKVTWKMRYNSRKVVSCMEKAMRSTERTSRPVRQHYSITRESQVKYLEQRIEKLEKQHPEMAFKPWLARIWDCIMDWELSEARKFLPLATVCFYSICSVISIMLLGFTDVGTQAVARILVVELLIGASVLALNVLVSVIGWKLYRSNWLRLIYLQGVLDRLERRIELFGKKDKDEESLVDILRREGKL